MRCKNRAPALACMDQPQVLRQVRARVCANVLGSTCAGRDGACVARADHRSHVAARTTTTGDSAHCYYKHIARAVASYCRTNLHLWCENEERHTVFKTRAWSSALLATQGRRSDTPH